MNILVKRGKDLHLAVDTVPHLVDDIVLHPIVDTDHHQEKGGNQHLLGDLHQNETDQRRGKDITIVNELITALGALHLGHPPHVNHHLCLRLEKKMSMKRGNPNKRRIVKSTITIPIKLLTKLNLLQKKIKKKMSLQKRKLQSRSNQLWRCQLPMTLPICPPR